MIGRVLAYVGLLLAGAVLGVLGAFVQADRTVVPTPWGPVPVPWGVVVVLVALCAVIRGAAWAAGRRSAGWLVFAGWLVATFAMATESPSGDLAIAEGGRQWLYLLAGVTLGAASATFPLLGGTSHTIDESPESTDPISKE